MKKTYKIHGKEFYQEELCFDEILDLLEIITKTKIDKEKDLIKIIRKGIKQNIDQAMRVILKPTDGIEPEKGFFNKIPGTIGLEVIADFFSFNRPESYARSLQKIFNMFNPVLEKMGIKINIENLENTLKDSFVDLQTEISQKEKQYSGKK